MHWNQQRGTHELLTLNHSCPELWRHKHFILGGWIRIGDSQHKGAGDSQLEAPHTKLVCYRWKWGNPDVTCQWMNCMDWIVNGCAWLKWLMPLTTVKRHLPLWITKLRTRQIIVVLAQNCAIHCARWAELSFPESHCKLINNSTALSEFKPKLHRFNKKYRLAFLLHPLSLLSVLHYTRNT